MVLSLVFSVHLAVSFTVIKDVQIENVLMIWYNSVVDRNNPYISSDVHSSSTVDPNPKQ